MQGFDHILNWKLKAGSHPFPGPDGGTCINEAALVAMGFAYRPVRRVEDMPSCFSRPICRFAMLLNDEVSDDERQRLLPYVTRLACADTPKVEREREVYIWSRMTKHVSIERGIEILEGALAIGRQADPLTAETVHARLEAMKGEAKIMAEAKVLTASAKPSGPLLKKVKSWFTAELDPAG